MSKCRCCKFKVLDEVFIDEDIHFDPDIADSLSDSSEQVSKTSWQDNVKIADSFHTHFDASNSQALWYYASNSQALWYLKCSFLHLFPTAER